MLQNPRSDVVDDENRECGDEPVVGRRLRHGPDAVKERDSTGGIRHRVGGRTPDKIRKGVDRAVHSVGRVLTLLGVGVKMSVTSRVRRLTFLNYDYDDDGKGVSLEGVGVKVRGSPDPSGLSPSENSHQRIRRLGLVLIGSIFPDFGKNVERDE